MLQLEGRFLAKKVRGATVQGTQAGCGLVLSSSSVPRARATQRKAKRAKECSGRNRAKSGKMMVAGADGDFCGASSLVPVEPWRWGLDGSVRALVFSGIRVEISGVG
jgi:hypothetical protein